MPGTTAGELCEASALLPPALRNELEQTYPSIERDRVVDELVCAFETHRGDEHFAILYDHFPESAAVALWARWQSDAPPDVFWLRPDCTARSARGTACGHFDAHSGPHSWQADDLN